MSALPLVTVITVTYNAQKLLKPTLETVGAQTYPHLEHLLVDGASKDGTLEVARQFGHPRLRVVSEPDKGLYDGMNKGLGLAQGEFVMFINAGDELYRPDTIEQAFRHWQGEDVLYGDTLLTDEHWNVLGLRRHKAYPEKLSVQTMRQGMVICHQSMVVRRSLAPEFNPAYKCSADIDWTIRLLKQAKGVLNTRLILSRFQVGGFSTQNRRYCWQDRFQLLWKHFGPLTLVDHVGFVLASLWRKVVPINDRYEPAKDGYI